MELREVRKYLVNGADPSLCFFAQFARFEVLFVDETAKSVATPSPHIILFGVARALARPPKQNKSF